MPVLSRLLKINKATYKGGFTFELLFNNGETHVVSLQDELYGKIFEPLNNEIYLSSFTLNLGTLSWENGADFAPEFLYELATQKDQEPV